MRIYQVSIFLVLNFLILSSEQFRCFGQSVDSAAIKYSAFIQQQQLKKHLKIFVSDSLEGRETTTIGFFKSANYVSYIYDSLQFPKMVKGSYFQDVSLVKIRNSSKRIKTNKKDYTDLLDFFSYGGFGEINLINKEIAFAGFGIEDTTWNSYGNIDVSEKVVMFMEGIPSTKNEISVANKYNGSAGIKEKLEIAKSKNAIAALVVINDFEKSNQYAKKVFNKKRLMYLEGDRDFPFYYISEKMANEILKGNRYSIKKITKRIFKSCHPISFETQGTVNISSSDSGNNMKCQNILGYLEGKENQDEVIVVSAHLDHLGLHDGKMYRGADDNASGCAAVLNIAEAFSRATNEGFQPKRSILFLLVTGEENGLLGSKYYTQNPVFPIENTVANLNIDMIGRTDSIHNIGDEYIYVIGSDRISPKLHELNEQANSSYTNLDLDYIYNDVNHPLKLYRRSDHYNFVKKGIPVIFYFSGLHKDYHAPGDTEDKIEYKLLEKRTKLVFHTLWKLAFSDEKL
jgi:hypothetical protein